MSKEEFELMMKQAFTPTTLCQSVDIAFPYFIFIIFFDGQEDKGIYSIGEKFNQLEQQICYVYDNGKHIWDQVKQDDPD